MASAEQRQQSLIGIGDVRTPYWAEIQQAVATAGVGTVVTAAVRVSILVARRALDASPSLSVLAIVLHLASGITTAVGLFATANVFTALLAQGPSLDRVVAAGPALVAVLGAYALRGLLDTAVNATKALLAPRVEQAARDALNEAAIQVELAAFEDADFVELLGKASHDSLNQLKSVTGELLELLQSFISMVAGIVMAGFFHPLLAPAVLLAAVPQGWAAVRTAQLSYASFVRMTSHNRRLSVTNDLITSRRSAAEVRAFTAKRVLLAEHRRLAADVIAETQKVDLRKALVRLGGRALAATGSGIGYAVLAGLLYMGALPLAVAGAAFVAMRTASSAVTTAVYTANRVYEAGLYLDMYVVCLQDAKNRARHTVTTVSARDIEPRVVRLDDVSFAYPGTRAPALSGVTLTLRAGQVVALVGENGSGKTTLAKVATGLYLPTAGRVTWDGLDSADIHPDELFDRISIIMQNPLEWPMTAENNIKVGRLDRAENGSGRVRAAAELAGAHEIIMRLPAGYDTVLSTRFQDGTDLSGGQWQRVGIARGLYRDAGFLVADEPSAALDARTEHEVFRTLHRAHRDDRSGRITLLITHRLANVRRADQIIVLARGRVAEVGTHDELMHQRGTYEQLFSLQASQYLDGLSGSG